MREIDMHQPHKRGANRKELARKEPRRDRNYSQSRDVWEDRCTRQHKIVSTRAKIQAVGISTRKKERMRIESRAPQRSWLKHLPKAQSDFSVALVVPNAEVTRPG